MKGIYLAFPQTSHNHFSLQFIFCLDKTSNRYATLLLTILNLIFCDNGTCLENVDYFVGAQIWLCNRLIMLVSSLTYQCSCWKQKVKMSVTRFWKSVTGDLKSMGYHLPFQWAAERYLLMKWRSTMSFYSAKQCWTNFFWGYSIIRYSVLVNGLQ